MQIQNKNEDPKGERCRIVDRLHSTILDCTYQNTIAINMKPVCSILSNYCSKLYKLLPMSKLHPLDISNCLKHLDASAIQRIGVTNNYIS